MERIFSTIIIIALLAFDSLEPILRRKELYFSIKINREKTKGTRIYKNYMKKILLITIPIGFFIWYYYPIESDIVAFICGFLVMVFLNIYFYFTARKEVKDLSMKNNK